MPDKIELDKIKQILDAPIFKAENGDYAMLANENDEQGPVNVFRKNGTIVMTMPREVWDELRGDKS